MNHTEAQVEQRLLRGLVAMQCELKKFTGYRGWPDRIALFPDGCVDWVELKRPKGGKFEPLQLRTHDKLRRMGFVVYVLSNYTEVDIYLEACREHLCLAPKPEAGRTNALRQARSKNAC
jgi:hypothetical protein